MKDLRNAISLIVTAYILAFMSIPQSAIRPVMSNSVRD